MDIGQPTARAIIWNTLYPTASLIVFYLAKYALTNEQSLQDLTKQESKTGTISVQVGFCNHDLFQSFLFSSINVLYDIALLI